jgi:Bacterial type II/III secretion system short domain
MFSINTRLTAILIITLMLASVGFAQTPQPAPAAASREPEYVEEKGFKSKVYEIKNRNPHELANVLRSLGSGFKGSSLSSNEEFKTITVRDFPENLATIEEALRRLDVPEAAPPRSDIEFHIHILIASNTPATNDDFPAELSDVVKQMQATLKYKNYGTMASAVHRATANGNGVSNNGVAESKLFNVFTPGGSPIFFNYNLQPIRMNTDAAGGPTVSIGQFRFRLRIPLNVGGQAQQIQYQDVGFETPVTVRNGERVVVGTTTMGDKGLIVVLSARFNNK